MLSVGRPAGWLAGWQADWLAGRPTGLLDSQLDAGRLATPFHF